MDNSKNNIVDNSNNNFDNNQNTQPINTGNNFQSDIPSINEGEEENFEQTPDFTNDSNVSQNVEVHSNQGSSDVSGTSTSGQLTPDQNPKSCPGSNIDDCIDVCPFAPPLAFKYCVAECGKRCP